MKIRILSAAVHDLASGKKFYELQQEGVGAYFLDSLYSDIESLLLNSGIHKKFHEYYRMLSKRFPYAIYYKVEGDEIKVYRILDCRQNPRNIAKALK